MSTKVRSSGVESRLLDLLEYRAIHGAVITTSDGLLVANSATSVSDAEQLAATLFAMGRSNVDTSRYWDIESEYGSIRFISGKDLRLIVLSEPGLDSEQIRPTLVDHLLDIEHMIGL